MVSGDSCKEFTNSPNSSIFLLFVLTFVSLGGDQQFYKCGPLLQQTEQLYKKIMFNLNLLEPD